MNLFKKTDCGCYGDGAFGSTHIRKRLDSLLEDLKVDLIEESTLEDENVSSGHIGDEMIASPSDRYQEVIKMISDTQKYLREDPSDDFSEEDDAIQILQKFTEEGLSWEMSDGDLILTEEECDE